MATNNQPGGSIVDESICWKHGKLILKPGLAEGQIAGTSEGVGTPAIAAYGVAAAELAGLPMDLNDEIYWVVDLQGEGYNIDLSKDLRAEIVGVHDGGGADTGIAFQLDFKGVAAGEALSDAKVTPDGTVAFTGLVAPITGAVMESGQKPCGVAGLFATHDANGYETARDILLMIALTMTSLGTGSADEFKLTDVRISYTKEETDRGTYLGQPTRQLT